MRKGLWSAYDKLQIEVQYRIRLNTDSELPVTRLGEPWTHHFCIGITFLKIIREAALVGLRKIWLGLIQPTISLEMPVPSQGRCDFPSFPVVDWFCLFVDFCVLPFPLDDCSVFGNFVITLFLQGALLIYHNNIVRECLLLNMTGYNLNLEHNNKRIHLI